MEHVNGNERKFSITKACSFKNCIMTTKWGHTHIFACYYRQLLPSMSCGKYCTSSLFQFEATKQFVRMNRFYWQKRENSHRKNWWTRQKSSFSSSSFLNIFLWVKDFFSQHQQWKESHKMRNCIINREERCSQLV